ncbi:oligosaccharide flippase family protein [Motilimonas eburnea]|uniref:oligosaccharide flippase family protein n=1 Tax=Motilimonas eburnea TaxID=1737488 RepID=UPI001E4E6979|nr:oligosaccharide flippase family protein [Motilimonas eburnea]MCE2572206.1 oligosaccharide flippase family protein [Motilimonas eburnea]
MTNGADIDAKKAMLHGAMWTVAMRWGGKFLGLISTIIVARLVLPEDYAVIAMAMLVVGLLEAFIDLGAATALIREPKPNTDFINSAWTLRFCQSAIVSLLLLTLASPCAAFFNEPNVAPILLLLAGCMLLNGANNFGLVLARKALNFALDFKVQIIAKSCQVLATVIAAYYLGDYRALAIGVALGYLLGFILSYVMHPYRPWFCTRAWPQIWQFSKWLIIANSAQYLLQKLDQLVAGRTGTSHEFGLYNVGGDLGQLPTAELGPAIIKSFLPVLSSIQDQPERVNRGVLKVLAILNTLTLPVGFGIAVIADPLGNLMLGPNWQGVAPFIALFGICSAFKVAPKPLSSLLLLHGYSKNQSGILVIELVSFILAAWLLMPLYGLVGLVLARISAAILVIFAFCYEAQQKCALPFWQPLSTLVRPLACALIMYWSCTELLKQLNLNNDLYQLAVAIPSGALIYGVLMWVLWLLCRKPMGLEQEICLWLAQKFKPKGSPQV